jgi:DNA-directed RNA polymerase subunit RPC12/RpoP
MSMQSELPKCPICGSTTGYELSGIVGKYSKCPACFTKWKLCIENQQLTGLILHELPKNGAALFKVASTNCPVYCEIGKPIGLAFWKNLQLDGQIDWEYLSKTVDPAFLNCIIKGNGESILYSWTGNRLVQNPKALRGPYAATMMITQLGALLLTNRRLIWLERRQTGVWKPQISFQVAYETPLENIKGISAESGDSNTWAALKKVSIVDDTGEKTLNLTYGFLEFLKPMIESAIKMRQNEIETEKKKDKVHVMLDFSFLKTMMEKGGLVMQVLKCPECGATVDFPKSGNETNCSHCGKSIYAQDVFEKVKGLI